MARGVCERLDGRASRLPTALAVGLFVVAWWLAAAATARATVSPISLTLSSKVSPVAITAGDVTSDVASLTGVPPGADAPTGTVTFSAYGPDDSGCSNSPVFTTSVPLSGTGTSASSGDFRPPLPGTYRWIASYDGDSDYASQATGCGAADDSVVVSQAAPSLSTTASPSVTIGDAVSDTAVLAAGDSPTGTISFRLFGPNDTSCSGTSIFTSTVTALSGNGTYTSAAFTASATGTYNWVVTYGGDATNEGATAACGAANESVVVTAAATQTRLDSSLNPAALGQPTTFTATVAGRDPTGTVTFMDGANILGTGAVGPDGTATFSTSSLGAGSHSVTAGYGGDTNNRRSTSNAVSQIVSAPASNDQPPSISIVAPSSGALYTAGELAQASYTCSAVANGPALESCIGTMPDGSPIDTSTPGSHTFVVTAAGADGESVSKTILYTVMPSNQAGVSRIGSRANGTVSFQLQVPGPGVVDVMETAWLNNYARVVGRHKHGSRVLLQPAPGRFVFARAHLTAPTGGVITVTVKPNSAGRKLLAHHSYPPVIRLWVTFTPSGGTQNDHGFYGLGLPDRPRSVDSCTLVAGASDTSRHQPIDCAEGSVQDQMVDSATPRAG